MFRNLWSRMQTQVRHERRQSILVKKWAVVLHLLLAFAGALEVGGLTQLRKLWYPLKNGEAFHQRPGGALALFDEQRQLGLRRGARRIHQAEGKGLNWPKVGVAPSQKSDMKIRQMPLCVDA